MNVFEHFQSAIRATIDSLSATGALPPGLDLARVTAEPPRDASHGDIATNAAMLLAKAARLKPRDLAEMLKAPLQALDGVVSVEIAGPGFINMRLGDDFWRARLAEILAAGTAYGDSAMGAGRRVNVEYVSANPTGPLHVGHGRGAVFGDALASLLAKAGFTVAREYYVNDAGAQVDVLARSAYHRYREALGRATGPLAEGLYPGDYLVPVGQAIAQEVGDRWLNAPESEWLPPVRARTIEMMMASIRDDLAAIGITHDVFSSERALVESGAVEQALAVLEQKGLIYIGTLEPPKGQLPDDWEPRPQTLFRSTAYGDDVDRPLRKSDGTGTYFASDIAYHLDKFRRGYPDMIDVWGADHGGYVKRVQAAVAATTGGEGRLDVKLCQLVRVLRGGELVRMSKRAGDFIALRDVVDEVGKDVVRFIMLTRKNDAPLDFDLAKVVEQSRDNPVFYVQYAHARACSVMRHAAEALPGQDLSPAALAGADLSPLAAADEIGLVKLLATWPRQVEAAAEAHEPHRIAFYLQEVAAAFHALWNAGRDQTELRFIQADAPALTIARLALLEGMRTVIASGLAVFGVQPVAELR